MTMMPDFNYQIIDYLWDYTDTAGHLIFFVFNKSNDME
jgi:hypothetical protein